MKKIFITGGNGFLGKKICAALKLQGHDILAPGSKDCDLILSDSLEQYKDISFDEIYHLAAWTQAGDFCLTHSAEQWVINQKINTNIINWWHENHSSSKFIFMGTSCAYSPDSNLKEIEYMDGEPIDSLYTYAMTKRMLLQGARAMNKQFGMDWLCLVPSTLYGSDYHNDGRQMHFIFDLVRKILRGKYLNEKVELWGDGNQRRELVYVEDFIYTLLFLNDNCKNQIINIGAGQDFSIKDFAKTICNLVNYDHSIIFYNTEKYVGAKSKKLDINKLVEIYPDYKEKLTSLDIGLKKVIDWFEKTKAYL
tara:strand:+ start:598 stop:1521 length:924 start_codon:yes stop_codon:yes gene_type:complete